MSCVLRVSGPNLDLDALLESFPLGAFRTWRKGEPRIPASPDSKVNADLGTCFDVSVADFDEFAKQGRRYEFPGLLSFGFAAPGFISGGGEHVQ